MDPAVSVGHERKTNSLVVKSENAMDVDTEARAEEVGSLGAPSKEQAGVQTAPSEEAHAEHSASLLVKNPSTDILTDFENALNEGPDFDGSIAFARTYDDAPNPIMSLDELGLVGLPLSELQARSVIEKCVQAPFGKGERTVVDKEVRDTWEMDAHKVKFRNPAWETFIQRVVTDTCQALGVNIQASKPRCELYKLLLYETGSHLLPHVDTEKTDGMFATIIIVLPSPFTGGDAHLSHGSMKSVLNSSKPSLMKTTVLSWYTDVMHEIKPITSGYRLALAYNLLHTTTSLRPALSNQQDAIELLRHIMLSWKQNPDKGPEKIIYLLSHSYSHANMTGSALKGKDAQRLAVLDLLAKQLGFHLGLANIEHHLSGYADDNGGYGHYGRRGGGYYDSESDEDDNVDFAEVEDETTTVENLVSLEGKTIKKQVDFDEETETLPASFRASLQEGDWDDQDYEGYQGNGAGSLDRYYRRTAVVIWPPSTILGNDLGDRRVHHALDCLSSPTGYVPSSEEETQFGLVCQAMSLPRKSTLKTLTTAALQWKKVDLWLQALSVFGNCESFTVDAMVAAIDLFGLEGISLGVKKLVLREPQNKTRFSFVATISAWGSKRFSAEDQHKLSGLLEGIKTESVDNIAPPTVAEEIPLLTAQVLKDGGMQRLKERLFPQLLEKAKVSFVLAFAVYLHKEKDQLTSNEEDRLVLASVVTELLRHGLTTLDFFQLKSQKASIYATTVETKGNPAQAFQFISWCLDCGNDAVAATALEQMTKLEGKDTNTRRICAATVLLPLLPLLVKDLRTRTPRPALPLGTLCELSVQHSLEGLVSRGGAWSREDIAAMIDAAILGDRPELVTSTILPKFNQVPWNEDSWKNWLQELHGRRKEAAFVSETNSFLLVPLIDDMAHKFGLQAALPKPESQPRPRYLSQFSHYPKPPGKQASEVLEFCLQMGSVRGFSAMLDRIITQNLTAEYISGVLVPLIAEVVRLAKAHSLPLTLESIANMLRKSMDAWADRILGPKPSESGLPQIMDQLKRWTCNNQHCPRVRRFLTVEEESTLRLDRIGAPARKHLEAELKCHAARAASFQMISSSPQGLIIDKADALIQPSRWKCQQTKGKALLKTIGHDDVLRRMWGTPDDFELFSSKMRGSPRPTAQSKTGQATTSSSRGSAPSVPSATAAVGATQSNWQSLSLRQSMAITQPRPAAPVTPQKRAVDDSDDVIDLTSP